MTQRLSRDWTSTTRQEHLRAGDVLGGKYRIERELGRGGMGIVYEVTHIEMPQARFAIKWLHTFADGQDVQRFRREARISGAIRHRHVIEVYDVNIDRSGAYMVMELLEGETLAARIARGRGLLAPHACKIIAQCLAGLEAAHAAGVIHRDIKPENIFLCAPPDETEVHPKVLDFGVSRVRPGFAAKDTTLTHGGLIGTPAYMAPEQLHARACDSRTDVYAMGATLYQALAGVRPFDAASYGELVVRIVTGEVKPLHERVPDLPAGLSDVVMRAMAKEPADRYVSAAAFAAALAPYTQPSAAGHVLAAPPIAASPARARWPSFAVGAGVLAALVTAWLSAGSALNKSSDTAPLQPAQKPLVQPASGPEQQPALAPEPPAESEPTHAEDPSHAAPPTDTPKQADPPPRVGARPARSKKSAPAKRDVQVPPPIETPVKLDQPEEQPATEHHEGLQPRPSLELETL
ncbi:MAG TPA: protein kinase [Polyangiales bacterium]|nr:protein kinase [Polyangiales bacterium]